MNPFNFYNPTRVLFGEGRIDELRDFLPENARILFTYDENAVVNNGVYRQVKEALQGFTVIEFSGIQPNPDYDYLIQALPLIEAHALNFIVAAGGGSVIDGSKFIAAAAKWQGDPWQMTESLFLVKEALPLAVIQTHPGSGTELNQWGVMNCSRLKLNRDFSGEALFPKLAILDPATTLTLPRQELTYAIVDAFSHGIEQYATIETDTPLQDRQAEAHLLTIIESSRVMLAEPDNLQARATFMWCSASILNDHLQTGTFVDFCTHRLSHVLTTLYGLKHAEALALLLVPTLSILRDMKHQKLCRYARAVWGLNDSNENDLINAALSATQNFFIEVGAEMNPEALGLSKKMIPDVLSYLRDENMYPLGECHPVYEIEAMAILRSVFHTSLA